MKAMWTLPIAMVVTAVIYTVGQFQGRPAMVRAGRLGTVGLAVVLALTGVLGGHASPGFAWAMTLGLVFGLLGDVLFLLPREQFVGGLAAYLAGHLCYIYGMAATMGLSSGWVLALPVLVLTAEIFRRVSAGMKARGQGSLVGPSVVYTLVLGVMLWRSLAGLFYPGELPYQPWLMAMAGAFFYLADAAMVWHRYVRPLRWQPIIEMDSYFMAQFLFAATVALPPAG